MGKPSEMALIRNLHWWTVEYGLIGTPDNFKLYGAGLLSSIGEAISCLKDTVTKLPYTLEAMNYHYDITKPQPQLFVTPDFRHLIQVLEEFKQNMAWTQGGTDGLLKAVESQQTSTVVVNSGLQITGTFCDVIMHDDKPIFARTQGPTALSVNNKQLSGYGKDRFPNGIGLPLGNLNVRMETLTDAELKELGILSDHPLHLGYENGISVSGSLSDIFRAEQGQLLFLNITGAVIEFEGKILASEALYTLPIGSTLVSVFAGPADVEAFEQTADVPREKMHKIIHDETSLRLQKLYGEVRAMRETIPNPSRLREIYHLVKIQFKKDWLLTLEIVELLEMHGIDHALQQEARNFLEKKASLEPELEQLIRNGLALLEGTSKASILRR
jgi:phenylalanine-4-hydroxylase